MRTAKHTLLMIMVLAGTAVCGGSDSDNALRGLSSEEKLEIRSRVETLAEEAGFAVVSPGYLPAGLDPVPQTQYDAGTALMFYQPVGGAGAASPRDGVPELYYVTLRQEPDEGQKTCPSSIDAVRECSAYLRGVPYGEELSASATEFYHEVRFRSSGLFVGVEVNWLTDDTPSAEEMQEVRPVGLKIAESMIAAAEKLSSR